MTDFAHFFDQSTYCNKKTTTRYLNKYTTTKANSNEYSNGNYGLFFIFRIGEIDCVVFLVTVSNLTIGNRHTEKHIFFFHS